VEGHLEIDPILDMTIQKTIIKGYGKRSGK
jgi:hypothetical protein